MVELLRNLRRPVRSRGRHRPQVLTALEQVLGIQAGVGRAARGASRPLYDVYLRGLSYLRKPKTARRLDAAEQLFRRALAEQPGFARAQAGLCQALVERYLLERVPAHVAAAEKACARARALDNTAHEVQDAVGSLRLVTGDAAEAEAAYRRALAVVPESPDALIGLAEAQADGNKRRRPSRRCVARSRSSPAMRRPRSRTAAFSSRMAGPPRRSFPTSVPPTSSRTIPTRSTTWAPPT